MSEQDALYGKDAQKTVIAFIAGLLIGGLLVWVFNDPSPSDVTPDEQGEEQNDTDDTNNDSDDNEATSTDDADDVAELPTGDGSVDVSNQVAGYRVTLGGAVFPSDEGWIGVRDYVDGEVGGILGVARFSKAEGLVPSEVVLLRPTVSGKEYAAVYFNENGDKTFNATTDTRVEGITEVFNAQ